jgi:hypothetical protein
MSVPPRRPIHRRSLRGERARRGGHEAANLAALEATFIGMLLVSSIAVVSTMETSQPSVPASRGPMEDLVHDILEGLQNLPTSDRYMSQMERAIGLAVLGNTTSLESFLKRTLPTGAECRMWIDNGHARRLLAGPSERLGRESVGGSRLYHPTWAYTLMVPSLDTISATTTLGVQGFAVSQGALVKEAGVPVVVTMQTSSGLYGKGAVTSIRDAAAASLYLKNGTDPTYLARDLSSSMHSSEMYNDTGNSSLRNSGNFTVPANTSLVSIAASFTGDVISYTITLTPPNGTPFAYPVTGTLSASLSTTLTGAEGVWKVTTLGTITGLLTPKKANLTASALTPGVVNYTIAVKEEANKPLPAGTKLTVRLPWTYEQITATNTSQSGWTNIQRNKTAANGTFVTAEMSSTLTNAERLFVVSAQPPALADVMYRFQAELSNGSSARATFIVTQLGLLTSLDNPLERGIYLSAPKPMSAGKNSTWGVLFDTAATTLTGLPETVTRLDVKSTDGTPLFASIAAVTPSTGWSLSSPDHVSWTGTKVALSNAVTEFVFRGVAASNLTADEPASTMPVEFRNGSRFQLQEQIAPYVFRGNFRPAASASEQGYEVPGMPPAGSANATMGVEWYQRALRVAGNTTYTVSAAGDIGNVQEALRLGLARSYLNLSATTVHVGESVSIAPDFQGLLDQINLSVAASGGHLALLDWHVNLRILDPLQGFEGPAKWNATAKVNTTAVRTNLTFTPSLASFYGPHAVLAEASFVLEDVVGVRSLADTARMLAVVDVLPDGGQSETALYWVSLECWMPDWQ